MISRSVTVTLALIGVLVLASVASAQALFRSDGLVAYDSTGKMVGALPTLTSQEVTFRTGAGRTLFLFVYRSAIFGNADLYFPQLRCAGQPFLTRSHSGREPSSYVGGPRQTVRVQAGAFTRRAMRSVLTPYGECWSSPYTADFAPAALAGINLADYFTPPFVIRATPGEPIPTGAVAEPLDPTDRLVVVDATGKKVGATAGPPPAATVVVVTDSGMTLLLGVSDSGIGAGSTPHFESTDCTGPPFISPSPDPLVPDTTAVGPRGSVYERSGPATRRTMSSFTFGGTCMILRSRAGIGNRGNYAPTSPIGIDLADYFTPPFTMRAGSGTRALPKPSVAPRATAR